MNLIKSTLLVVLTIQLLGFIYIKLIHEKSKNQPIYLNKVSSRQPSSTINNKYLNTIINSTIQNTIEKSKEEKRERESLRIKEEQKQKIEEEKRYSLNRELENYAKKFLGNKYVWGATGPKTFDCSGFTQKVYRDITGIRIPRVSREQAKVGKYINYNQLQQGDMVFFDTTKEHKGRVNHVGIYLGNGKFIHASSGGKRVMITNFNKRQFYKNRFLWGRRVIDNHSSFAQSYKKEFRRNS